MMINLNSRANVHEEYINALEEERRKIQVFQRELPLCLQLVTQAIESCKEQLTSGGNEYNFKGESECSEQTSSEGPVLEEFIQIKRLFSSSNDDEEKQYKKPKSNINEIDSMNNKKSSKNSDWLRSAQLWNQSPDPTPKEGSPKVVQVVEVKRDGSGCAFHPFKGKKSEGDAHGRSGGGGCNKEVVAVTATAASSSAETGESSGGKNDKSKKQEKEGQSQRKQRRSWSPELHKKFLNSLQQLGGAHAATPKQIKELMSVDGLTNDEVKSHLQKYRLHTRRQNTSNNNNDAHQRQPHFVVVGGLWVPPTELTAISTTLASVQDASMSSKKSNFFKKPLSDDWGIQGGVPSNSPAASSSNTTTASPPSH